MSGDVDRDHPTRGAGGSLEWRALDTKQRIGLICLILILGVNGVGHFVATEGYVRIVPRWVPDARLAVLVSGVGELAAAGLLATSRTRRLGAWISIVVLAAVFPANVHVAVAGHGPLGEGGPGSNAVAWARLPFQALFVWWAWILTRPAEPPSEPARQEQR